MHSAMAVCVVCYYCLHACTVILHICIYLMVLILRNILRVEINYDHLWLKAPVMNAIAHIKFLSGFHLVG